MKITGQEYRQLCKKSEPKSPILSNCIKAFLIGGLICTLGQLITMLCQNGGLDLKMARSIGSISLILLSMILTGLNVFDNIAKHAGAGTIVPITGFANAMVSPAIEFKSDERDIIGLSRKAP